MSDNFLDFTGMNLEINYKKKTGGKKKPTNIRRLNNQWIIEKSKRDEDRTVLRGKFIVIQAHVMIQEKSQIIEMHIKETRRRTSKTQS